MFCPNVKKIHKFKLVHCKRNSDLFAMYGKRESNSVPTENGQIIPMNQSKIDSIEYLNAYDQMQAEIERERAGTGTQSNGYSDSPSSHKDDDTKD